MKLLLPCSISLLAFALAGCAEMAAPSGIAAQVAPNGGTAPEAASGDLFITNVSVIEVTTGKAIPKQTVTVKGDRVIGVGPADEARVAAGAKVIDGTGKFLIPGLWDMHVHIVDKEHSNWFLRYGVTGVRHMFAFNPLQVVTKPVDPASGPVLPRVVVANQILDGPDTPFKWPLRTNVVVADDSKTARVAVREVQKKGNDFLKVYSWLPREAYFGAVEEAKKLGIPVAGHVPTSITVAEASDAGQLTIEHLDGVAILCSKLEERHFADLRAVGATKTDSATGWRIYAEAYEHIDADKAAALLKKFVKNDTWQVPTLIQNRQMAHLADVDVIPADVEKELPGFLMLIWKRELTPEGVRLPNMGVRFDRKDLRTREALSRADIEMVRRMHKAGVRILAGTDTSAPFVVPGLALHQELGLLVEAGLTPAEALRAATVGPARCMKAEDRLGTIEVGKLADMVLLGRNPLDDIRNTRTVEMVLVGGRIVP